MFLEHLTLAVKTFGRSHTRIRQLCQCGKPVGILGSVDVDIHIGTLSHLQSIRHLETVPTGYTQTSQQLIEVGTAIGRTHLHGLLDASIVAGFCFQRIGSMTHIHISSPTQGHTNQYRTVAITPTDIRRSLLMRHKTEVAGWILVAKSGDRRSQFHHAGNHSARTLAENTICQHLVLSVLDDAHVDMQTRASLARRNLGCKGDIIAQLVA